MIKFSDRALGRETSKANTTYIFPKIVQGFTVKENYKGHCHVLMWGQGGLECYLGSFPNEKIVDAFIEDIWNRIKADDNSIIDLDELGRNYGQN